MAVMGVAVGRPGRIAMTGATAARAAMGIGGPVESLGRSGRNVILA